MEEVKEAASHLRYYLEFKYIFELRVHLLEGTIASVDHGEIGRAVMDRKHSYRLPSFIDSKNI
ncbi:MAG: hypothetical protein OD814_000708 [Candidatus Alkanophagales archaeon MCA70_species_1]|nr:hypothetical protein [Candidatus Alkanophaga volatiphilum]